MFGLSRLGTDVSTSVRKACSASETAPKRKHVRACIVYTWDNKSSKAFWEALKSLSLQESEVQAFKALMTAHKVCQEGHVSALIGGYHNIPWIESLGRYRGGVAEGGTGRYGRLIHDYAGYLIEKLRFHHDHGGFTGTFEYKEYVSLSAVSDPNEGYQNILDLLDLQDSLDSFGKVVMAAVEHNKGNECMIAALVPQITESYGMYKFLISMLRAMYRSSDSPDALQPLKDRFVSQHYRLYNFYADCSAIRSLTSLITIPKLPYDPPNLMIGDDDEGDTAPREGAVELDENVQPQQTGAVNDNFAAQQRAYELQQQQLAAQQEQSQLAQQQQLQQQQQYLQEQQRLAAEAQQQAQQQLLLDQAQRQAQGRVAELERDLLSLRGQVDQGQLMLESYDQKVQALEAELNATNAAAQQQIASKDEQIQHLQEQSEYWKNKYESLAKLYTELRAEYLNLLAKMKKVQQKAASAQEAVEKRERLERDMKAKNIELADLIKERDRARLDLERAKVAQRGDIEKLEIEKSGLETQLAATQRTQSDNMASVLSQHQREMQDLQAQMSNMTVDTAAVTQLQDQIKEKDMEIEMMQQTMDETVKDLADSSNTRLSSLVDAILGSGIKRIQDAVFLLDSPMEAGNQNSSPSYVSTLIEKGSGSATDFANSFNSYLIDGHEGDFVSVIDTITNFATSISELLMSTKGLTRLTEADDFQDDLLDTARDTAEMSEVFLESLLSKNLTAAAPTVDAQTEKVINGNLDVQEVLQTLSQLIDSLVAPGAKLQLNGDLSEAVDSEMARATQSIDAASKHLYELLSQPLDPSLTQLDAEINKSILGCALAIIDAIKLLLQASIASQEEIVNAGRGSNSKASFYKKNNKWTEGLISASKDIAYSTNVLIQTADGVLQGSNSNEQLIVASREVAASTAQLVAAARVKSDLMSKSQDNLESCSKKVNLACKQLVAKVNELLVSKSELDNVDYSKLSNHENKTAEMEQQVEILKLEKALDSARKRLGEIRKFSYRDEDEDDE